MTSITNDNELLTFIRKLLYLSCFVHGFQYIDKRTDIELNIDVYLHGLIGVHVFPNSDS